MFDRHLFEPVLLAFVAFGITVATAITFESPLGDEMQESRTPAASHKDAAASSSMSTGTERSDESSGESGVPSGGVLMTAVFTAASESKEVARTMHDLLAPKPSE